MLIKSNFKDYYDYLIGQYGIDEKVVYERICSTEDSDKKWIKSGIYKPQHTLEGTVYSFDIIAVCGIIYCCYYYRGKHYFGSDAIDYIPKKIKRGIYESDIDTYSDLLRSATNEQKENLSFSTVRSIHLKETNLNEKENCPVLILRQSYDGLYADVKNPKLSDFDFGKILSAEECYLQISNFLSREKPIVDNRTDIQKITGKGFDKKTSFRNIKK